MNQKIFIARLIDRPLRPSFVDEEIEKLQKKVAEKFGYTLVDHKLELYGIKKR